ncbi:L-tryptophan--pyruvate aminotransferase 1 [Sesamum angolense]|uniref:L-tryptophan--pyruvate aminotransferase 1 n=1 Tax=Sesamum angolense TaxID=2727404 RepID=A0AAE1WU36_9LAMI|nr:L-tryptophan--pyruvate aminotransferase 1 [Sesamum angolense]
MWRWALVRDKDVAKKMVKFIEINTIGVSKEAQLRAASILEIVSASCQKVQPYDLENFFEYSKNFMAERWKKLRDAVKKNELFSVTKFPRQYCGEENVVLILQLYRFGPLLLMVLAQNCSYHIFL